MGDTQDKIAALRRHESELEAVKYAVWQIEIALDEKAARHNNNPNKDPWARKREQNDEQLAGDVNDARDLIAAAIMKLNRATDSWERRGDAIAEAEREEEANKEARLKQMKAEV